MTYPQTNPAEATTRGKEYWRLFTDLESSGDIYEAETSARAFVIGAQSDIAQAVISYLDPQGSGSVSSEIVSVKKPLVGRIDASLENYPAGLHGRILISLADILPPPNWEPADTTPGDVVTVYPPAIDLYQYLQNEPTFFPQRADRIFRRRIESVEDNYFYAFPFYGRRLAQLTWESYAQQGTRTISLIGVNFSAEILNTTPPLEYLHQEVSLGTSTATSGRITVTDQPFDYLIVSFALGMGDEITAGFTLTMGD